MRGRLLHTINSLALSVTCGDTLPLLSLRDIFPRPGEVVPQGDGFSGGEKVSGSAIRRPLGGAGCERSEQTEGGFAAKNNKKTYISTHLCK